MAVPPEIDFESHQSMLDAVTDDGIQLEQIPCRLQTYKMIEVALKQNWKSFRFVHCEKITQELAELAVQQNPYNGKDAPPELITLDMCYTMIEHDPMLFVDILEKFQQMDQVGDDELEELRAKADKLFSVIESGKMDTDHAEYWGMQ
jgi:hypothetical protein